MGLTSQMWNNYSSEVQHHDNLNYLYWTGLT